MSVGLRLERSNSAVEQRSCDCSLKRTADSQPLLEPPAEDAESSSAEAQAESGPQRRRGQRLSMGSAVTTREPVVSAIACGRRSASMPVVE